LKGEAPYNKYAALTARGSRGGGMLEEKNKKINHREEGG
jgi:hypothetical protein